MSDDPPPTAGPCGVLRSRDGCPHSCSTGNDAAIEQVCWATLGGGQADNFSDGRAAGDNGRLSKASKDVLCRLLTEPPSSLQRPTRRRGIASAGWQYNQSLVQPERLDGPES